MQIYINRTGFNKPKVKQMCLDALSKLKKQIAEDKHLQKNFNFGAAITLPEALEGFDYHLTKRDNNTIHLNVYKLMSFSPSISVLLTASEYEIIKSA